jgi:hypothetical protein
MKQYPNADTHFGLLGFVPAQVDGDMALFNDMMEALMPRVQEETGFDGRAYTYADPSGAAIRVAVSAEGEVVAVEPSFASTVVKPARLEAPIIRESDSWIEQTAQFWITGDPDTEYPLIVALSDPRTAPTEPGATGKLSITAFAQALDVFADEAAFSAHQEETHGVENPGYAPNFFIPTGMFVEDGPPQPYGLFAGTITSIAEHDNALTGLGFLELTATTLGGPITVIVNHVIGAPLPKVGDIVQVSGWLSAGFEAD